MSVAPSHDVLIVGAGHNGLVAAFYLARAGLKVLVLEASTLVGGAAVTREFAPGFRVSSVAHLLPPLSPRIAKDLGLDLKTALASTALLLRDGGRVEITPDVAATHASIAKISPADADAFPRAMARWSKLAFALSGYAARTPPRPDLARNDWQAKLTLGFFALSLRRLGRKDMLELTRIIAMNVADLANEAFESDPIKGLLAWDGVLGLALGPRSPSTVFNLLYRMAPWRGRPLGFQALPKGGMGALSETLRKSAEAAGATVRIEAPVARILIERDQAAGVTLRSGEEIRADIVVSNLDPVRTAFDLIGAGALDAQFVHRLRHLRMNGCAAKVHLALDGLPAGWDRLTGRALLAPGIDYVERAYDCAKYGRVADHPALELTIPSLGDPGLAPAGKHVASIIAQYAPYRLKGATPDEARDQLGSRVIDALAGLAPDLASRIIASEILIPHDLEREYGMTGGQWHHGEVTLDQVFLLRPVPGFQQYRMPVPGVYLCGAGAHPGGNLTGQPGANAAREILKDRARGKGSAP